MPANLLATRLPSDEAPVFVRLHGGWAWRAACRHEGRGHLMATSLC